MAEQIDWGDTARWGDNAHVGPGWEPVLLRLEARLRALAPMFAGFADVKQRFGVLKVHLPSGAAWTALGPEEVLGQARAAINEAEAESARICEACGEPGAPRTDQACHETLCDGCAAARGELRRPTGHDDEKKEREMADDEKKERMDDEAPQREWSGVKTGWRPIVLDLERRLRELVPGLVVQHAGEKWGGLRIYWSCPEGTPEDAKARAHALVSAAEEKAYGTCQKCGGPGSLRKDRSWVLTLCDGCQEGSPGAVDSRRGPGNGPDAALSRRLSLIRSLRGAFEETRRIADHLPDELAGAGLTARDTAELERLWRAALASLPDVERKE